MVITRKVMMVIERLLAAVHRSHAYKLSSGHVAVMQSLTWCFVMGQIFLWKTTHKMRVPMKISGYNYSMQ